LFLKGERCFKPSCAIEKRNFQPASTDTPSSEDRRIWLQLREKAEGQRIYGILENQFRTYFEKAARQKASR
jgi:small subunit ribosomal protein S4